MTDADTVPKTSETPLIIVLAEPGSSIDADWLADLRDKVSGSIVVTEGADAPDACPVLAGTRGPWWHWLGDLDEATTRHGVILLANGLVLPRLAGARIAHLMSSPDCPPLLAVPGNHEQGLDPAGGLDARSSELLDSIVHAASGLQWSPIRYRPERLAVIAPGAAEAAGRLADDSQCWLYDGLRVHDPDATDADAPESPDVRAALGPLRRALQRLEGETLPDRLPLFGFDDRPTVLHVSHDWGGGVARWIDDIVADDDSNRHLVLSSAGHTDGDVHGQWLKLYAAGPGHGLVRQWTLAPAIAGTDTGHESYRAILNGVIGRFGVARIVVSSLIGHSLDALATGLPTVQMLHDYYPAWPALDLDPAAWENDGRFDLDAALADQGRAFLFAERRAEAWRALTARWLETVKTHDVALAAPANHVIERWRRLAGDDLPDARVIPHGFAGWPDSTARPEPRPLADGRLNLVVVGRLSTGKGLHLLERALPDLRSRARVTLLGCGHHGMRFFGQPDVDIVLDYDREDLPQHLDRIGAQAVMFLSTVAETWNYVLSETRALGLVPLAARTGSFVERIDDGVDGVLFDPVPDALIAEIDKLHSSPERLEAMRSALPKERPVTQALAALDEIVDKSRSAPRPARPSTQTIEFDTSAPADLADSTRENYSLGRVVEKLRSDLKTRTDWARKQERLAGERTKWAFSLQDEVTAHQRQLAFTEAERHTAQQQAEAERSRADHLDGELQAIFASRSWRLTRPLRVAQRIVSNAIARRVYNPLRWPRLLARLVHNLRLYGPRGTLDIMQLGQDAAVAAPTAEAAISDSLPSSSDPVAFPSADDPLVSIVIPVYNKLHYTAACLNSLAEHADGPSCEVIVVDDCSDDDTPDYLAKCSGLVSVRNKHNSGFIASCNAGAEAAHGRYLVFLNNDTTVTDGWLDALVETFSTFPDTGVVGARLVYPDGSLQEAGGIVFNDGSGWNYGRGDEPDRTEYNFACEADYVSGACLAVERSVFARLAGFDSHYAPAYYEDTDLCFRIREAGLRVIYQPGCTIVHHEGVSSGTDETSGTKRYQAINREKFVERWQERLGEQPSPVPGPEAVDAVVRARHHRSPGHVLVVDAVTPEPDKDSGSMRMVAMLGILRDLGYRVTFMPENLSWVARYTPSLQRLGIETLHHPRTPGANDWLAQHGRNLSHVFVSRHYVLAPMLPRLRKHCPDASIVFDTVDLHFLREERMAKLAEDEQAARIAQQTRRAELELIRNSDATLVVSPVERELLSELEPASRIEVLSNIHRVHGRSGDWHSRCDLMFVGGFQHPPNIDAAEWLIDDIMPRVRAQLPDARLHLIGSRMPDSLRERRADNVVMHGFVEDLTPYLRGCRLSLAPLRYGAGVKGKVNQAMSWGLPVVATSCAAEGMYLEDGRDVLIADTAEAFADAIARAYSDETLWTTLSDGGLANVEEHFSFDAARRAISGLLDSLTDVPARTSLPND